MNVPLAKPPAAHTEGASPRDAASRTGWPILVVATAFIALWPLLLRSFGGDGVYLSLGLYSLLIIAAMAALGWKAMHRAPRALLRNAVIGLTVGVLMTVATYGAYHLCVALIPALASHVGSLYAATRTTHFGAALAWTLVAVVAEELLWRGPLLEVFPSGPKRAAIVAASLATYTVVQLGTGSWVVALAAFLCGAIWMSQRLITKSIVAPLISHAIWTITVIHLYPVTT